MTTADPLISSCASRKPARPSAWPARLDLLQSATGLLLVLFMAGHGLFVASILISPEAMYRVTKAFEGVGLFGRPFPLLVSLAALGVLLLFALHAGLALRKFPGSFRQYRMLHRQRRALQHRDTTLWVVQLYTGFALLFLGSAHLIMMMMNPAEIGPFASADRTWSGMWSIGLLLLLAVEVHAGVGLYRLVVKWIGLRQSPGMALSRPTIGRLIALATFGFILLGLLSLATYLKIGYEHRDRAGERYQPAVSAVLTDPACTLRPKRATAHAARATLPAVRTKTARHPVGHPTLAAGGLS